MRSPSGCAAFTAASVLWLASASDQTRLMTFSVRLTRCAWAWICSSDKSFESALRTASIVLEICRQLNEQA